MADEKQQACRSVDRMLDIIEAVGTDTAGLSLTEIAKSVGLPKSTVFRLIASLTARSYLVRDEGSDKYRLGYRFLAVAGDYLSSLDVRSVAAPFIRRLSAKLKVTVHIAVRNGDFAVYIEKLEPYSYVCSYSEIGRRIELYCSSLGKALMIGMANAEYSEYLKRLSIFPFTSHTLKDVSALDAEIRRARETGLTFDNQEHEDGVFCAGSPIFDASGKVVAALSISALDENQIQCEKSLSALLECAADISEQFGSKKEKMT